MRFADIPGHEQEKERLRALVDQGHMPHALLLEGPAGSGKFMLARALSAYIHCTDRQNGDSCGRCPACVQAQSFNHLDTIYSFPLLKKNSRTTICNDYLDDFTSFISESPYMDMELWLKQMGNVNGQPQINVDEGAELLRRVTFKTRGSSFKTVLIWLPERMHEATANKLLKMVEEAYQDTLFIMTSDRPRAVLPTIYSRCQRVVIRRYSDQEIEQILINKGADGTAAHEATLISGGNVNVALKQLLSGAERQEDLDLFADLMRKAYARKVAELRKWSELLASKGREPAMRFIEYCTRLMRESLLMHLSEQRLLTLNNAEAVFLSKFYPFINEKNVLELIDLFDRARRDIAGNGNAKIIFFDLAVRTIILIRRK